MILGDYYTTDSAAQYLGVTTETIRKLTREGKISAIRIGSSNVYARDALLACRRQWYADGMSHKDIAEKYGQTRTNVIYHFDRLKVEPVGVDGRRKGRPRIFNPSTVKKFAKIIGWTVDDGWTEGEQKIRCPNCGAYTDGDNIMCECGQRLPASV